MAVTAQKFRGLFRCFNSKIFTVNHVSVGLRPGMGRMIGSKIWDQIVEFFGDFMGCP